MVGVGLRPAALVQPVVAGEVVGVLHSRGAAGAGGFLVPVQFLQRGQDQPGRPVGQQPDERGPVPGRGDEVGEALDDAAAAAAHDPRRHPVRCDPEVARRTVPDGVPQRALDLRAAAGRPV